MNVKGIVKQKNAAHNEPKSVSIGNTTREIIEALIFPMEKPFTYNPLKLMS